MLTEPRPAPITFAPTHVAGTAAWEAKHKGSRAVIYRIGATPNNTYRLFVYGPDGRQIVNPDDMDEWADAARDARWHLRHLADQNKGEN